MDMGRILLVHLLSLIITQATARIICKRQTSSCPSNCFRCDGGTCRSCNSGWYGADCSISCSQCQGGCHQDAGHCLSCPDGTFGSSCAEQCPENCMKGHKGSVTCDVIGGQCDRGCVDGYYGDTCNVTCGMCSDGICSQDTGQCNNGCTDGWGGPRCSIPCIPNCRTCTDNSSCVQCFRGYYAPVCSDTSKTSLSIITQETTVMHHTTNSDNHGEDSTGASSTTVGVGVGVGLSVVVLAILIIVIIFFYRRHRRHNKRPASLEQNENINSLPEKEPMYVQDEVGSPRLSRSYLQLDEVGLSETGNKEEQSQF